MVTIIEYKDYSLAQVFLAEKLGLDALSVLEQETPLQFENIEKWTDLYQTLESGDGLFEDTESSTHNLFRLSDGCEISEDVCEFLSKQGQDIYLIRPGKSLNATDKKVLKKFKFDTEDLKKPDPQKLEDLITSFEQKYNQTFEAKVKTTLIKYSSTYIELLNSLDLLILSEQDPTLIQSLKPEESLPIFMRQFPGQSPEIDKLQSWANTVPEEVQLYMSVAHTKLAKQSSDSSSQIRKLLIETDQKMKTNNDLDALAWWKLFLWKATKI
jgi:hypothetical protein